MKCVLRRWGQLKRGFVPLKLGELRLVRMGEFNRGFEMLVLGELRFEGMEAVVKGVSGVGIGLNVFCEHVCCCNGGLRC